MPNAVVDTRIPLDWEEALDAWAFPVLDYSWANFHGLLMRDGDAYSQIPAELYALERSPAGQHQIKWTGGEVKRPARVYGLVAITPKPPGTFLGLPVPIIGPILAAFTGLILGLLPYLITDEELKNREAETEGATTGSSDVAHDETASAAACEQSDDWVSAKNYADLQIQLLEQRTANDELAPYKKRQETEIEFGIDRPTEDRILYVLGESHGLRLEALRHLHTNDLTRKVVLDVENDYVEQVLTSDASNSSFTRGKSQGQEDAIRLIGLGSPKALTPPELTNR